MRSKGWSPLCTCKHMCELLTKLSNLGLFHNGSCGYVDEDLKPVIFMISMKKTPSIRLEFHQSKQQWLEPTRTQDDKCAYVCQPLFQRGFSKQGCLALMSYHRQRSCGHEWEEKIGQFPVPALSDSTKLAYWLDRSSGYILQVFLSGNIYLLRTQHFDWLRFAVNYMDTSVHLSSVWLPVGFRKPQVGTAPGVILASRGVVILQTDSVSADVHFFPSFSRFILGLAFLSCFPVMLFMVGVSDAFVMRLAEWEFYKRTAAVSQQRNTCEMSEVSFCCAL